jgi:hypothetical protein
VRPKGAAALAWEERWSRPAGIAALLGIGLVIVAIVIASQGVGNGEGDSELLRNVDAHRGAQLLSSILQMIGVGLLALPLYVLFRAAQARSDAVRGQLIGVVIAAPLFLAAAALLSGISTLHAASEFVGDEVPRLLAKGVALNSDRANDVANDAIVDAPLRPLAAGFGIGGQIGFVVGMFYTAMHAMRVGLLTRFWGSLGMALGAVSPLFFQFTLLWYVFLGLLFLGFVPGGRPPAWETGEAMPWPSPGEKAAEDMSGGSDEQLSADEQLNPPPDEDADNAKDEQRQPR